MIDYADKSYLKAKTNEEKLEAAINYLSTDWVLHADYVHSPRHTNSRNWVAHSVLRDVQQKAREAGRI